MRVRGRARRVGSRSILLIVTALALLPPLALATPFYTVDIVAGDMQNNFNVPKIIVRNQSTAGEMLTGFAFTVGDSAGHFFDFVANLSSGPAGLAAHVQTELDTGASLIVGDRVNDRSGVDRLEWSFSDFAPGEELIFQVDVDPIGGVNQTDDARIVFFNNGSGGAGNSLLELAFDGGAPTTQSLPDAPASQDYYFGNTPPFQPIPEPTTALLLWIGLGGLAVLSRRAEHVARRPPSANRPRRR